MRKDKVMVGLGIVGGVIAVRLLKRRARYGLRGKTVFVTGGSRGLGFVLARELAGRGARVAICARDSQDLTKAADLLLRISPDILPIEADMTMREEAEGAVQRIRENFGPVDVLINNAGIITVGPMESMTIDDYRNSVNTHFWGPYFATMAVLPDMRKRGHGRIVNISSVGGKISVPHLLPYSVGKFALTGFSQGLRAGLLRSNIYVTTVCPGLMRTGSPRNAFFKGNNEAEYAWFSVSDSLPLLSMNAARAARKIIYACEFGIAEVILSFPAKLAIKLHSVAPETTSTLMSLMNRLLPPPGGIGTEIRTGKQSSSAGSPSWLTTLSEQAAENNNEVA